MITSASGPLGLLPNSKRPRILWLYKGAESLGVNSTENSPNCIPELSRCCCVIFKGIMCTLLTRHFPLPLPLPASTLQVSLFVITHMFFFPQGGAGVKADGGVRTALTAGAGHLGGSSSLTCARPGSLHIPQDPPGHFRHINPHWPRR